MEKANQLIKELSATQLSCADLASFVLVAETEHIGHAADELAMSQSTLTRRVQRVEKQYGAALFDRGNSRDGRTLRLNARGRAAYPAILNALDQLHSSRRQVRRLMDPDQGSIRLDFMHSLGTWLVPTLLRKYRAQRPQVQFELHQGAAQELVDRVSNDQADIAFVGPRPKEADEGQGLGWHLLHRQQLAVAFPAGHPLAEQRPLQLAEVAGEHFIGMLPGYGTRMLLDQLAQEAGFTPNLVFESMELTTVMGLVKAELGVALLPMDDPHIVPDTLVLRPLEPVTYRELGMVWRQGASSAPPVDAFRDFVEQIKPQSQQWT